MVNPEVQQAVNSLIQNHGRIALNDTAAFEALLREAAGDKTRDANLLIGALKAGVPQEISLGNTDGSTLAKRLEDESFLAPDAARSAVEAWANALGATMTFAAAAPAVSEVVAPAAVTPPAAVMAVSAPAPQVVAPPQAAPTPQPVPAPQAAPAPQPYGYGTYPPQGAAAPRKPNTGAIIAIIAVAVLIIGGGIGFAIWKSRQGTQVGAPVPVAGTAGGVGLTTGGAPVPTTGAGLPAGTDFQAYNAKLAEFHTQYIAAFMALKDIAGTASTTDENAAMDTMKGAYLKLSESLEILASNLDALTPPTEAAEFHRVLATGVRNMSSLVGEGATAAASHDQAAFMANSTKIQTAAGEMKAQLDAAVQAAGFSLDKFNADGTLVKG